jgi:hypothetical protein
MVTASAPSCPTPPGLSRVETYLFMVYSELSHANVLRAEELKQARPDLAAEVRYRQFETSVAQRRSSSGFLKFQPLRLQFKEDYDALRARYVNDHPDVAIPE